MRQTIGLVVVLCCAIAAMAATPARAQTPIPSLDWQPCPAPFATSATPVVDPADFPPGLECAFLAVPLDYANPEGEQVTIGLNRLRALDPEARIGSLVFNPGGPGGAGSTFVALEALGRPVFTPAVREHFDVIGMDPRGVGTSTRVRCDPELWNSRPSQFPREEAAFAELREHGRALGESCLRLTGPLLAHLDTTSVARDLEAVRVALGEGPLNYLGLSYGSQLGTAYAELFPENIRVMALDGALDHSRQPATMLADEAAAYEDAFARFARWCADTPACALHDEDVTMVFDDLVRGADETPIPAPACAESGLCRDIVTGEDIRFNVQSQILFKEPIPAINMPGWPGLAAALETATAGDASALSTHLAQSDRDEVFAGLAIECVDWPTWIDDIDDLAAQALLGRVVAPHTQGASQTWTVLTGCLAWPVPVVNPPHAAEVHGAPPILLVNATHDPSTAYVWAHGLLNQIAGSVLLTRDGDGHTSYWLPGPSQTRDAIDHYLITGETTPPNAVYDS